MLPPEVSCLIPSALGDPDELLRTTLAVASQTAAPRQTVVYDVSPHGLRGACDTRARRWLEYSRVEVIRGPAGASPLEAREQGLAYCVCPVVWLVDDDAAPHCRCLEALLAAYHPEDAPLVSGSKVEVTRIAPWPGQDWNGMAARRQAALRLPWGDTANLLVTNGLLRRAHERARSAGWDERMDARAPCPADIVVTALAVDLCGRDVVGVPEAVAWHLPRAEEPRWHDIEGQDRLALAFLSAHLSSQHLARLKAQKGEVLTCSD